MGLSYYHLVIIWTYAAPMGLLSHLTHVPLVRFLNIG
jgi:hypothetical protein